MIFDAQMKNENLKLCDSNRTSWSIAASVFCRARIRLRNPSFCILMNLCHIFSRNFKILSLEDTFEGIYYIDDFKNIFQTYPSCLCDRRSIEAF